MNREVIDIRAKLNKTLETFRPSISRKSIQLAILAIVKELVAAHGDAVGAELLDGRLCIWFSLPLNRILYTNFTQPLRQL